MILFDGGTVPGPSNIILELVGVYEDQGTQEGDEDDQEDVEDAEESVHLENTVAEHESGNERRDIVDESESVPQNVPEDGDEAEDAKGDVE